MPHVWSGHSSGYPGQAPWSDMEKKTQPARAAAFAVHVLTASGAVCGLMALVSAGQGQWATTFAWLGAALIIDAVDGPLARRVGTHNVLPRFSGERLDLIVDYLNYAAIPAFILTQAQIVPPGLAILAASLILLSSLYHFADQHSKTEDGYFVGFPAIWNIVLFYFFVFDLAPWPAFFVILLCAVATFIPVKWVHPVRVVRFRPLTLLVTLLWAGAAIYVVYTDFLVSQPLKILFGVTLAYGLALGFSRSVSGAFPMKKG